MNTATHSIVSTPIRRANVEENLDGETSHEVNNSE